jgi:hypothetical protein
MSEKGLFYNAFPDADSVTGYDRNYNGDDLSNWFSIVCDTGVVKAGLAVTAGTGLSVNVAAGKATIKGKGYINDAIKTFTLSTAPTGSNPRYDMVILRMDNTQTQSGRRTYLLIQSVDSVPAPNYLTRNGSIYDLLLAYVTVQPNATSISQSNITDCRGQVDFCPWFTAVKGYDDYYDAIVQQFEFNGTMASAGTTITTNIPTNLYNDKYSLVEVYCNGLKEENTDYTVGTSGGYITITFTSTKSAGAQISVILNNFIDGEGLPTAIGQYNQWAQAVADLQEANEHTYVCNGLNDNVNITNIVNTFMGGRNFYDSMRLKIVGNFGCQNGGNYPLTVGGSGTAASPYLIFNFNNGGKRKVVLDFTDCNEISVPISGVYASIFKVSGNVEFVGLNLYAQGKNAGTSIKLIDNKTVITKFENCRFFNDTYTDGIIAYNGIFTNCYGEVANVTGNSYCFQPYSMLQVKGGEYRAYTGNSAQRSAIIGQSEANVVSVLYGVNMPVVGVTGYYQTHSILQWSNGGYVSASDLITTLTDVIASGSIRNTIAINKPNSIV